MAHPEGFRGARRSPLPETRGNLCLASFYPAEHLPACSTLLLSRTNLSSDVFSAGVQSDGSQALWINGVKKIDVQNMRWRTTTDLRLNEIRFDDYMSQGPKTEHLWVDDVTVSVLANFL